MNAPVSRANTVALTAAGGRGAIPAVMTPEPPPAAVAPGEAAGPGVTAELGAAAGPDVTTGPGVAAGPGGMAGPARLAGAGRAGIPMTMMPATMNAIPAMATGPGRSPRMAMPASAASRAPVPRPIG